MNTSLANHQSNNFTDRKINVQHVDTYEFVEFSSESFGRTQAQLQGIPAAEDLIRKNNAYSDYISLSKPFFSSNIERNIKKAQSSIESTVEKAEKIIDNIHEDLDALVDKRKNIEQENFLNLHSSGNLSVIEKFLKEVLLEQKLKVIALREEHLKLIEKRVNSIFSITNQIGNIAPDIQISIKTLKIRSDINAIKKNPQYIVLKRRIKCLKFKLYKKNDDSPITYFEKNEISPDIYFERAFLLIHTDIPIDDGCALFQFMKGINQMPSEYKESLINKGSDCTLYPQKCGEIILEECQKLKTMFQKSDDAISPLFYLFSRHIFDIMYYTHTNFAILQQDLSFLTSRIEKMSTLPPCAFGQSGKYVPEELKFTSVSDLDFSNTSSQMFQSYNDGITFLEIMKFQTCPIDFCSMFYTAISSIQKAASEIAHKARERSVNHVIEQNDSLLGVDDLNDMTFMLLLKINPIEIIRLEETFEPYIKGLQMTSELLFAFTNLKSLCEIITKTDIDKFMRDAEEKVQREKEKLSQSSTQIDEQLSLPIEQPQDPIIDECQQ